MVDALERAGRDLARNVWPGVRDFLETLLLFLWTGAWLTVAGLGHLFSIDAMVTWGIGVAAVSGAGFVTARVLRRRRMRREAATSLVARARLERLRLSSEMEAIFVAFDQGYRSVRAQLVGAGASQRELGTNVLKQIDESRDHVFSLAVRERELVRELDELRRHDRTAAIQGATVRLDERIRDLRREADDVADTVQKLSDRIGKLGDLSRGELPSAEQQRQLTALLEDLDRTEAAYREIDEAEQRHDPERLRARLAAERTRAS
ncbi:hypothetical protein L6R52_08090 [Myxococcota bacterium]|nr:hypothetical protein [Myxococcota bacterium]